MTQLKYVYGFTEDSFGTKVAWRRLEDAHGKIIQTEIACHVTEPSGGYGLMIGHFGDGTSREIPGMWSTTFQERALKRLAVLKRPAGPTKRPAIKSRAKMGEVEKRALAVLKRPAGPTKRPAIAISEIPGMLSSTRATMGEVRKMPSSVLKAPAGPMKRPASECDAEEFEAEPMSEPEDAPEEHAMSEPEDAPAEPEDAFLNQYVDAAKHKNKVSKKRTPFSFGLPK